jgi:hypothetical protein
MMNLHSEGPAPDPRLREALDLAAATPEDSVDWDALRAGVRTRAEMPLARQRRRRNRSRWVRTAAPAAVAAALAALMATGVFRTELAGDPDVALGLHPVVEQVLGVEISEFEMDLLFGQVSADNLVVAAVDQR